MAALGAKASPGAARAWWWALRPRTLPAALAPVLVGTALAASQGAAYLPAAAAALGVALLLQVAANLVNDYADFERGSDGPGRLGPARAAQSGWISPAALRRGAAVALLGAALLGVGLALRAGWPLLLLGAAAMLCAWAYTGGATPLGYRGLGDPLVFVFFGPVAVCGSAFVQSGQLPLLAVAASLPLGLLATSILAVNNLRDREGDARAGKRTLAVRLGGAGARRYACALVVAAYLSLAGVAAAAGRAAPALLPLVSLPLAAALLRRLRGDSGAALNPALAAAAQLELAFAALLALGVLA